MTVFRGLLFPDHRDYQGRGDKTASEATKAKRGRLENRDSLVSLDSKAREVTTDCPDLLEGPV